MCSVDLGTIAGDFSGHNYASGRLDNQLYHKSILVDRSFWESEVLNPIFSRWFREYALVYGIEQHIEIPNWQRRSTRAMPVWKPTLAARHWQPCHTWYWDAFVHVDPAKEADAQAIRLANNVTTLAAECAKDGCDYMNVLSQRAKELAIMKELGIRSSGSESSKENKKCQLPYRYRVSRERLPIRFLPCRLLAKPALSQPTESAQWRSTPSAAKENKNETYE